MRYLLMLLGVFALFFTGSTVDAATVSVAHQITVRSDFNKVVTTCRDNRVRIMESTGMRILKKVRDNRFRVRVDNNEFTIEESHTQQNGVITVRWQLVESRSKIRRYSSVIEYRKNGNGTNISGRMTAEYATRGQIGSHVMEAEIRRGISAMQQTLLEILGE